jgi:hypothetical protein
MSRILISRPRALATHVEADAFDDQADAKGFLDEIDGFAGIATEFRRELDHGAGVGNAQAQNEAGVGRVTADLAQLG